MGIRRRLRIRALRRHIKGSLPLKRKIPKHFPELKEDDPLVANLKLITSDFTLKDDDGNVIFRFWKKKIPVKYLNNLKKSSRALKDSFKPRIKNSKSYHLGFWRRYRRQMFRSADANYSCWFHNGVFLRNVINQKFFRIIDTLFRFTSKRLYKEYKAVETPGPRLVGKSFLMCVVNWGATGPHYDHMDRQDGLCCVVPFNNFKGGDLVFRDLGYRIKFEKGDVIFFQSHKLLHENLPVTSGERQSIVFCSDKFCF